jgi:L-lysine 2,3-aminomutase
MTPGGTRELADWLITRCEVTCVQFAGDDLLAMAAPAPRAYLGPLLQLEQLKSIQAGTPVLGYWPRRFLADPDADDTLRLFGQVTASGKARALMARFAHPRQLEPRLAGDAMRRIGGTGVIRTQAPLIGSVNDAASVWAATWRTQVRIGMVPDVMVIEPVTGLSGKFVIPLARAHAIFAGAYAGVTGLARTVRGPAMPTGQGTACLDGIADTGTQKASVLRFTEARDPDLAGQPFSAAFGPRASWSPT